MTKGMTGTCTYEYFYSKINKLAPDELALQNMLQKIRITFKPISTNKQVSNVTKRGCLLSWKPPSDNGGHQISHYEVEKCETGTDQWLPIKNAKGLSLEVNNLVKNGESH